LADVIETRTFAAPEPGPRVLLFAGVHGDEIPGVLGLEALAAELSAGKIQLFKGAVTVAARVNAAALAQNRHFLDENLNRIMGAPSPAGGRERGLAAELAALIETHDAVLDLHATQEPSRPFAFLDDETPACRAWADVLGVDFLLAGWPALYVAEKTLTTTEHAARRGKLALTVEIGDNADPHGPALARAIAHNALARLGVAAGGIAVRPPRLLRLVSAPRRSGPGAFAKPWKSFDRVRAGEPLARYEGGEELRSPVDGFVVMPHAQAAIGEEWYYLAADSTP
jgi:predicted deacylase